MKSGLHTHKIHATSPQFNRILSGTKSEVLRHVVVIPNRDEIIAVFSTVRGYNFSNRKRFNQVDNMKGEKPMFVAAVVICLLVFAALASADLLVENINSDELSNMGVEKRS